MSTKKAISKASIEKVCKKSSLLFIKKSSVASIATCEKIPNEITISL